MTTTPIPDISDALKTVVDLKEFLVAAPVSFSEGDIIRQFRMPTEEKISCVRWNNVFYVTGTDIMRTLAHRFAAIGREITNRKKFEEGVFSDLRNLKTNQDATLERPKSELLEFLYKHHCVRTKKKQKVFFWYSVRHSRLFLDALERELKKEATMAQAATGMSTVGISSPPSTEAVREPALSLKYDSSLPLRDQIPALTRGLPPSMSALLTATVGDDRPLPPPPPQPPAPVPMRQLGSPIQLQLLVRPLIASESSNYVGQAPYTTSSSSGMQTPHYESAPSPRGYFPPAPVYDDTGTGEPFRFFTENESDFPLEYLVQEDTRLQQSSPGYGPSYSSNSFDERYRDFAYTHRPGGGANSRRGAPQGDPYTPFIISEDMPPTPWTNLVKPEWPPAPLRPASAGKVSKLGSRYPYYTRYV